MAFKMKGFSAFTKEKILPEEEASKISAEREEKSQKNWKEGGSDNLRQTLESFQKDLADARANNEKTRVERILKDIESIKKEMQKNK